MAASMFEAVVQHPVAPQRLLRMRTNGGIRNGHGAIYNAFQWLNK